MFTSEQINRITGLTSQRQFVSRGKKQLPLLKIENGKYCLDPDIIVIINYVKATNNKKINELKVKLNFEKILSTIEFI